MKVTIDLKIGEKGGVFFEDNGEKHYFSHENTKKWALKQFPQSLTVKIGKKREQLRDLVCTETPPVWVMEARIRELKALEAEKAVEDKAIANYPLDEKITETKTIIQSRMAQGLSIAEHAHQLDNLVRNKGRYTC